MKKMATTPSVARCASRIYRATPFRNQATRFSVFRYRNPYRLYSSRSQQPIPRTRAPRISEEQEGLDQSRPPRESNINNLDVLGDVPIPSTSVDICYYDGFKLNSGNIVADGDGVLLYGGEAFRWRPWVARDGAALTLLNGRGQWDVSSESFNIFEKLWPRPDMLIIGTGPEIRPLAPEVRDYISRLGIRVDILDTRNAAAQYNMLATERGELDVAAALIPIGWKEGVGAK